MKIRLLSTSMAMIRNSIGGSNFISFKPTKNIVIEDSEHTTKIGKDDELFIVMKQAEAPRMSIEDDGTYAQYWFGVTNPENFKHLQLHSASPSGLVNLSVYRKVLPTEFQSAFDNLSTSNEFEGKLRTISVSLENPLPRELQAAVKYLSGLAEDLASLELLEAVAAKHAETLLLFRSKVSSLKDVFDLDYSQKEISGAIEEVNASYRKILEREPYNADKIKQKLDQRAANEVVRNQKAEDMRKQARKDDKEEEEERERIREELREEKVRLEKILLKFGRNASLQRTAVSYLKTQLRDTELHQYISYEAQNYLMSNEHYESRAKRFRERVKSRMGNYSSKELKALINMADPRLSLIQDSMVKREHALTRSRESERNARNESVRVAKESEPPYRRLSPKQQKANEAREKARLEEAERQRQRDILYNGDLFGNTRSAPIDLSSKPSAPSVFVEDKTDIEIKPEFFNEVDPEYSAPRPEHRQKIQQFIRSMPSPVTRYNASGEVFVSDGKSLAGILLSSMDVDRRKNTRNAYTGTVPGRVQLTMNIQGRYESNMMGLLRSLNSLGFELKIDDNFKVIAKHKTHRIAITLSLYPNSHNTWSRFRMVIAGADSEIRKLSSIEI